MKANKKMNDVILVLVLSIFFIFYEKNKVVQTLLLTKLLFVLYIYLVAITTLM